MIDHTGSSIDGLDVITRGHDGALWITNENHSIGGITTERVSASSGTATNI